MKKKVFVLFFLYSSLLLVLGASQRCVDLAIDDIIQSVYDGTQHTFLNHENAINVSHLLVF